MTMTRDEGGMTERGAGMTEGGGHMICAVLLAVLALTPFAETAGPVVCIELADPPAAKVYAGPKFAQSPAKARAGALEQLAMIARKQDALLERLRAMKSPDVKVLYRLQRVFNGIVVKVPQGRLDSLRGLPGVVALRRVVPVHPHTASSVPFISAPGLWEHAGCPLTGEGIRIGIIDTGIDYLHADFGGPGADADYEANDPAALGDAPFPTAKIAGGYDFVGEEYDSEDPELDVPDPDPDPMDLHGHGTHVAGIVAGFGVNEDGTTYAGPYDTAAPFPDLKIGPGAAPEALLYSLKVFSSGATSSVVLVEAIEWATDPNKDGDFSDRLDVVNLSLGSPYGSPDAYLQAVAIENAVSLGMIVVASAGNNGDVHFVADAPGALRPCISVAAVRDDGLRFSAMRVAGPESIAGLYQIGEATFGPGLSETEVRGMLVSTEPALACGPLDNPEALAGNIALLDRGTCLFGEKVMHAQEAGAIAAVVVNNVAGDPQGMSGGGDDVTIPSVMVSEESGRLFREAMETAAVEAGLSSGHVIVKPELGDTVAGFSSRGPSRAGMGMLLKPDVCAPGGTIFSAVPETGVEGAARSGTSMAAPHVAGVMALLRQSHPDWSAAELKALVMNTATHDIALEENGEPPLVGPPRIGAGRVDAANAATSNAIAYDAGMPEAVSVSFEAVDVVDEVSETRSIRVSNKGDLSATYDIALDVMVDAPGIEFVLAGQSDVTIPASGTSDISVTMNASAGLMRHTQDPGSGETQNGEGRHWITEEAAYIVLTPRDKGVVLRVPLYAAPRPASAMHAATQTLRLAGSAAGSATIELAGQDALTGDDYPVDVVSLVTPFELKYVSGEDNLPPLTTEAPMTDENYIGLADIKYVGVTSDYSAAGSVGQTELYFAIVVHGTWGSPRETQITFVIDTDEDGTPDYELVNEDNYPFRDRTTSDVFVSFLRDLHDDSNDAAVGYVNARGAGEYDTRVFLTNAMVLPVSAASLGLTETGSSFKFYVKTYSDYFDEGFADFDVIEQSRQMAYDVARPGLSFDNGDTGIPMVRDAPAQGIRVEYDLEACRADGTLGVLLTHHHNQWGERGEVLSIEGVSPVLDVLPPTVHAAMGGGAVIVSVRNVSEVPMDWRAAVAEGGDWLYIVSGARGTDEGDINLGYDANPSDQERTGIVRVTSDGAFNSPFDIEVVQGVVGEGEGEGEGEFPPGCVGARPPKSNPLPLFTSAISIPR